MSIYGSRFSVGFGDRDDDPGVVLIRDGGRNDYPAPESFRRGAIDGASIPAWCVPGHREDFDGDEVGAWYRLTGCSWRIPEDFPHLGEGLWTDQEYLLDEDAVRALRDDLTAWLVRAKAQPVDGAE